MKNFIDCQKLELNRTELDRKIDNFMKGIFSSQTRRFGTIAEIITNKVFNLTKSNNIHYDGVRIDKKVEIKASRVLREHSKKIKISSFIEDIFLEDIEMRLIKKEEAYDFKFDCNIQQIKKNCFDELFFSLFFKDCICFFQINSEMIDDKIKYSDFQHFGNIGEGQFHINNKNLKSFEENFLLKKLNYEEVFNLF